MRVDWLDDLVAVLDNPSLNDAAKARYLTQPAFSRRIKALEELLGFEIIDRSARPARPVRLLTRNEPRIRTLASDIRHLLATLRQEGRHGNDRVAIASQHSITTSFAPGIVEVLSREGQTQIRLRSANFDECHAWLMTRQVDLSLTYRVPDEPNPVDESFTEQMDIGGDQLIPVFAKDQAKSLIWGFHHGELPLIAYPSDVFLGQVLNKRIIDKIDSTCMVRTVAETALTIAALQMSKHGIGLAFVPHSLAAADLESGVLIDLSEVFGHVPVRLIASRLTGEKSPVERQLWTMLSAFDTPSAA